jgi:hypothetical protein
MFENLKSWMLARIERDCVKSELGGRVVYLKKSRMPLVGGEWKEVNLPVNENGSWNIPNLIFGGKRNLVILIFFLVIAGFVFLQFKQNFDYIEELRNLPCVQTCLEAMNLE